MYREDHEKISLEMFGSKFTEIHDFLDQYFPKYGPYHRLVLHHQLGISLVCQKFSGPVRAVAEQHILDDLGKIPNDWREFDFELDYADWWLRKKTRSAKIDLKGDLLKLYPDSADLLK